MAAPAGFFAAGVVCGIKPSGGPDLALLLCDPPAEVAALFTTNAVKAAPVRYDQEVVRSGERVGVVVANSGVANACTGEAGERDCREMARLARYESGTAGAALVLSTGVIGKPLAMEPIRRGIHSAALIASTSRESAPPRRAEVLQREPDSRAAPDYSSGRQRWNTGSAECGGDAAARAIMTTDTRPKSMAFRFRTPAGGQFTIGGMAKGAGMIHPNMATMLAVLTTDAPVPRPALQAALRRAADRSFHAITVDGDSSTNDTVLLLASGVAHGESILPESPAYGAFERALTRVCVALARMIAADGEGARRRIQISVRGADGDEAARAIGRAVGASPLVKTALGSADPNWGRVAAAAGRSGERIDPAELRIAFASRRGRVEVLRSGTPLDFSDKAAGAILAEDEIQVRLAVGRGPGRARVWTCDLSEEYVRINSRYTT